MITMIKKTYYTIVSGAMILLPAVAGAQYSSSGAKPGGVVDVSTANGLIMNIAEFLLSFLAILAVLMIIVSGVMYITSAGDKNQVDKAKSILLYAIIGLIIALFGYAIVYVIGRGLGASGSDLDYLPSDF